MRTQSISFGKTPVMTCTVKGANKKDIVNATLYQMDPHNNNDQRDVRFSKNTHCIKQSFERDCGHFQPIYEYYLLTNDKTQEVIACAQTSRHYRTGNARYNGCSTLIDEMSQNRNYINGAEPVLAYIVHNAEERYDKTVTTAFDKDEIPCLKNSKFTQLKTGDWCIPEKRYQLLIDQAEKRENINFVG